MCLGRHTKRTDCTQKSILISTVEDRVAELYEFIALPEALRDDIESILQAEFESMAVSRQREADALNRRHQAVKRQQAQLLQAHYAGAVPLDLLKEEQDRLGRDQRAVETRLSALHGDLDQVQSNLKIALDLARDCGAAYRAAPDAVRRMFNQAFFTRIEVEDDEISATLAEPFEMLNGRLVEVVDAHSRADRSRLDRSPKCQLSSHVDAILRQRLRSGTRKPAQRPCRTGLKEKHLVPPTGFEPVLPP
jgi:site-specific DNA recombinase